MSLRQYVIKRTIYLLPIMFGLITLLFFFTRAMPGDPALLALGDFATKEQIIHLRHIWGLDKPLHIQYLFYIRDLIRGDWGKSLQTMKYVKEDIARFLPATIELAIVGMSIATIIGLISGIVAAHNKDKWQDHFTRLLSLGGIALPRFWIGIVFQIIFGWILNILPVTGRIGRGILPPTHITGLYTLDSLITFNWIAFYSSIRHIFLPAITYSLGPLASISRLLRSCMIDETTKDYVISAKANGIPEKLIVYVYMLKNSIIPVITMTTLSFARSLGGTILVESVFNWPGMGLYLVNAIKFTDINSIIGSSIIVGFAVIMANFFTDILYSYIDPRITYGETA